ncbi:MAG: putative lipid II flippase FtsW [Gammaproteobacteria bacterium]
MSNAKNLLNSIDFSKVDYIFLSLFLSLSICGLLILASASVQFSDSITGSPLSMLLKQFFHLIVGFFLLIVISFTSLTIWERLDRWLLFFGIFLLLLVFVPGIGVEVNGANRWIRLGGFGLQPSEVMKFISIVYISAYSVRRITDLQTHWFGFFKPAFLIIMVASLILLQPDLGTSAVIFLTVLGILFIAGVHLKQFLLVLSLALLGVSALIIFVPWRWERIISFTDPWSDPFGTGYQLTLSLMSIGRGDWFGVGLGEGLMKMGYLPDAHTDFIYSVLVEEIGLLGGITVISLLFGLAFRCFYIAKRALIKNQYFGFFAAYGVAILIGLHTFINVGVATGLLPTKGLTLPFISYGGTNLLVMCSLIGLVLRIDYETKAAMPVASFSRRAS